MKRENLVLLIGLVKIKKLSAQGFEMALKIDGNKEQQMLIGAQLMSCNTDIKMLEIVIDSEEKE